jgi:hypothetical protein
MPEKLYLPLILHQNDVCIFCTNFELITMCWKYTQIQFYSSVLSEGRCFKHRRKKHLD